MAKPHKVSPLASEKGRSAATKAAGRWEQSHANGRAALVEQRDARKRVSTSASLATKPASLVGAADSGITTGKPGNGDYSATPLSPSSNWKAGASSGSFSWTYPMPGPPTVAGPVPQLAVTYDAGSVDGRTAITNNQTSVIGEGFDLSSSYVERTYLSCHDDGHDTKYDLCWNGERLRFVLNGQAAELVALSANEFRLKGDDGTIVERRTGASNGDNNGEYWVATAQDGTEYTFGIGRLPGWTTGAPVTNSTWTVPVYSDDASDPAQSDACKKSTFDASWCQQAWRWNLDLVEDRHDNAASYWYVKETNYYSRGAQESAATSYTRGGYLSRVDYGLRKSALFDGTGAAVAPQRITLAYAERCLAADCTSLTENTKYSWPDVPFDSICASGSTCAADFAPTFFTRKRLSTVTTSVGDAAGRRNVDKWTLKHIWVDPGDVGDTTDQVLWPTSIQHAGLVGGTITEPALKLTPTNDESMRNRVDTADDGIAPLIRPRLSEVITEAGGIIDVSYSPIDCQPGSLPTPATNTRRCFPTFWAPNGGDPAIDWFHKYVVTDVMQVDTTTGDTVDTEYLYGNEDGSSNDAAWHYSADPQVADAHRTWSEWRGYDRVATLTGVASSPERAATVSTFYRGMNGDRTASGGAKTATVSGIQGSDASDSDEFAGRTRETVTYLGRQPSGSYGPMVSGTMSTPWSQLTQAQTIPASTIDGKTASAVTIKSFKVRDDVQSTWTRVTPSDGAAAYIRSNVSDVASFDSVGLPLTIDAYALANATAAPSEQRCTQTWYARTSGVPIVNLVARSRTVARSCADAANAVLPTSTGTTASDLIADTAVVFDGSPAWDAADLTRGNATKALRVTKYTDTTPTWQTVTNSAFDDLGRTTSVANADNVATTTAYTPAGAGLAESLTVTNVKGWVSTTTVDPARMTDLITTDVNGKVVEKTYDALGRVAQVWTPASLRALGGKPSFEFSYHTGGAATGNGFIEGSWIATYAAKGNQNENRLVSYEIFDALQRPRQTQTPSPLGGRVLTDQSYSDRGIVNRVVDDVWDNSTAPNGNRQLVSPGQAVQTDTTFDGANRPTAATTSWATGTGRSNSTVATTYTGDSVATTPAAGASATRVVTDVVGRTIENRTYSGNDPDGTTFISATSAYNNRGLLTALTGPDSTIRYYYDALGRQTRTADPDRGTTVTTYDTLDRVVKTTDGANRIISTVYDDLDRPTSTWSGAASAGTKLTERTYDSPALGQPATSTRYAGGRAYTRKVVSYDGLYRPTKTQLILPADDPLVTEGSAGVQIPSILEMRAAYNRDGTLQSTTEPAVAGLAAETISREYTDLGLPTDLFGTSGVVDGTEYNQFGDPIQTTLSVSDLNTNRVWLTYTYDGLRRPDTFRTTENGAPNHLLDLAYRYDEAGKITQIADNSLAATGVDYQCFRYDGYQRLTTAWTPKSNDCALSRTTANMATTGAPYWHDFTYKPSGLRAKHTIHGLPAGQGDKIITSTYDGTCGTQVLGPHVLNKTVTTDAAGATTDTDTYCANASGETTSAEAPDGTSLELGWNEEGHLANVKQGSAEFTNIYDAEGNLLIRRPAAEAAGVTTLYLGATEVQVTKSIDTGGSSFTAKGMRYYEHNGQTIAVRTASAGVTSHLVFQAGDHHGTASVQWDALAVATTRTKRHTDPFGAARGIEPASPAWGDDKRFLGKSHDPDTGLTHIGARDYQPDLARFLSVDPILVPSDPQSLSGYTYANNNPINMSDPSGLRPSGADDGLLVWDGHNWVSPGYGMNDNGGGGDGVSPSGAAPITRDEERAAWEHLYVSTLGRDGAEQYLREEAKFADDARRLAMTRNTFLLGERMKANRKGVLCEETWWCPILANSKVQEFVATSAGVGAVTRPLVLANRARQAEEIAAAGDTASAFERAKALSPDGPRNFGRWGDKVWGHGPDEALALIGARTVGELRDINGLTIPYARLLREVFRGFADNKVGGGAAPARVKLLDHIIKMLGGGS